jgi:hypothetical protein
VSLSMTTEPRMSPGASGLEGFSLGNANTQTEEAAEEDDAALPDIHDADSFFNLPDAEDEDEDESRR